MTNFLRSFTIFFILLISVFQNQVFAQVCSDTQFEDATPLGGGQFELEFTVCFPAPAAPVASSGVVIVITGANIVSTDPTFLANGSNANMINSMITGGTLTYGDIGDPLGSAFLVDGDGGECQTILVTVDAVPIGWQIYGQNFNSDTNLYECDESDLICLEDAGNIISPSDGDIFCYDETLSGAFDFTIETSSEINAPGTDACVGYGFWVLNDPLGVHGGLGGIGSPPSGGDPTLDPNYIGVFAGDGSPGSPVTVTPTGNGASYFIAPITFADCSDPTSLSFDPNCVSVGPAVEVTYNAVMINTAPDIFCSSAGGSTVDFTFTLDGGSPSMDGSDYNVSASTGSVSPGSGSVGTTFTVSGVSDGTETITVFDGNGCSYTFDVGPIVVDNFCSCNADVGTVIVDQSGDGATSGTGGPNAQGPFIMCWNDVLNMSHLGDQINVDDGCTPANCTGTCEEPEVFWTIHAGAPTSGNPTDPSTIATSLVRGTNGTWQIFNDGNYYDNDNNQIDVSPTSNTIVDNTLYLILSSFDYVCCSGGSTCPVQSDANGNNCFDFNPPVEVVLLNQITETNTEDCNGVNITLSGGSPQFFSDSYNLVNTGPGTLSQGSVQFGNTFSITGLDNGDSWSVQVTDSNGCPETISGSFNGIPSLNFSINPTYCAQDGPTSISASPASPSSFFSGPGIVDLGNGTGTFDPQLVGVGTHDITYHYTECTPPLTITEQITVNPAPAAILSGGGDGCAGNPSDIFIDITGGVGPYEVTYKIDDVEQPPIELLGPSPVSTTIPPTIEGNYTLCLINDLGSALCDGTGAGEALIVLQPVPMVDNNRSIYSCIDSGEFDLSDPTCDDPSCGFSGAIDLDGGNNIVLWEDWDFTVPAGDVGGTNDITGESSYIPPGGCGSNIYAQVINGTGCFSVATITLHCISPPVLTDPLNPIMLNCGDDLDLQLVFDSTAVDPFNIGVVPWDSSVPDGMGGLTNGPNGFGTNIVHPDLSIEGTYTYNVLAFDALTENCFNEYDIEVIVTGCSMGCIDWSDTPIESCGLTHIESLDTDALGGTWVTVDSPAGSTTSFSELGMDALITVSDCGEYAFEYTVNNANCQDLDTLYINFENNTVVNLEISCNATLDYCPVDCHEEPPTPEDCPDNMFTLTSPSGPPAAIWGFECAGTCDGVPSATSSGGGKQSTFFDGTTFYETVFLDMFSISGILADLIAACPVEASCFSANMLDDCIIESTTTTETIDVPVLLGGAWTVDNGTGTFIPFNAMNQATITTGGFSYEVTLNPSADTWSPVDITVFQMNGGVPGPIMNAVEITFLWEPEWGIEQITRDVTEYEIDPACTGCANGYTITINGPTMPAVPPAPCGPVSIGFGPPACDETYTDMCDDMNPCTDNDMIVLAVCDDSVCEPCMGIPVTEPVCDDMDCTNGIEIWNPSICECEVTPTIVGCTDINSCNFNPAANCDDGSCVPNTDPGTCNTDCTMGDLESWNATDCQCEVDQVVVPGCIDMNACNFNPAANCDDGSCIPNTDPGTCNTDCTMGDLESWNATDCQCEVDQVVVPGCIDMNACNFNPAANCDDGSCIPNTDPGTCNTDCTMGDLETWNATTCQCEVNQVVVSGCIDMNACNFNPAANCDDGSCIPNTDPGTCNTDCTMGDLETWNAATCQCDVDQVVVPGCIDMNACNFNPAANCDDGSCIPNTDPGTCNTDCTMGDLETWNAATCQCDVSQVSISGCTTPGSCNFDPNATCDDGSCISIPVCNTDPCVGDTEMLDPNNPCNCILDEVQVLGCTNPASCNFNPNANCDDGTCITTPICNTDPCIGDIEMIDPNDPCNCITTTAQVLGCTNMASCNFNPNANCDDGSCTPTPTCNADPCIGDVEIIDPNDPCSCVVTEIQNLGCTDPTACNYNPNANCDDGSCITTTTCDTDPCSNGGTYIWDTNSCMCVLDQPTIDGCTNPSAPNYNPAANCDDGSCDCIPDGCIDPTACNFDINATCPDGSCIFETACDIDPCTNGGIYTWDTATCNCELTVNTVLGCTNPASCNFDPNANCDDGSCEPATVCNTDPCIGDIEMIDPNDPCNCIVDIPQVLGCTDPLACNFDVAANCPDGSCIFESACDMDPCTNGGTYVWDANQCACVIDEATVIGCTDATSPSYNPAANCSDPTACDCTPDGCTDVTACNFDPNATCPDGSCIYESMCDMDPCTNGGVFVWDPASCDCVLDIATIDGCTNPNSCNYNPAANCDDNSCIPNTDPGTCNTDCTMGDLEVWDATACQCVVDVVTVLGCTDPMSPSYNPAANCEDNSCDCAPDGCTDPNACNYDPNATCDDGSCIANTDPGTCNTDCLMGDLEVWDAAACQCVVDVVVIQGCTDPMSPSYDPNANCENMSCDCTPDGCTDPTACNFDPNATCPDGSCIFETACDLDICTNGGTYVWDANACDCVLDVPTVEGCTDPNSCNYDPAANCDNNSCIPNTDPGTCNTDCLMGNLEVWDATACQCVVDVVTVLGCTDPMSPNYDPAANCDNMSCDCTPDGCTDPTACNFDPNATCDDGSCIANTDPGTCNTDCLMGDLEVWDATTCQCVVDVVVVQGCTDPMSPNYDPAANCENMSCDCTPDGCTDPTACNFDPNATCPDGSCIFETTCDIDICTNGGTYVWDANACDCVLDVPTVDGCTDPNSCNYDPAANCDDNSCIPNTDPGTCNTDCLMGNLEVWDATACQCVVDVVTVLGCTDPMSPNYDPAANCDNMSCDCTPDGCTDPTACNYDPNATCDDGSCIANTDPGTCNTDCLMGDLEVWDATTCQCVVDVVVVQGCTDPMSPNYDPAANCENMSCDCTPDGCTDPTACNFDPNATCPDGSCIFETTCDIDICTNGGTYVWDANACDCVLDVPTVDGCTDPNSCNYDPLANCDDNSCIPNTDPGTCNTDCLMGDLEVWDATTCQCVVDVVVVQGCTDPMSPNYDPAANCENMSCDCTPDGCTDPTACNFDPNATCPDGSCIFETTCDLDICTNGGTFVWDTNTCDCVLDIPTVDGCTDPNSCNYNPAANCDDNSCIPNTDPGTCNTDCLMGDLEVWDATTCQCVVDVVTVLGCTDPMSPNYDPAANCDNMSCDCTPDGCTDPTACNYDPNATCDDGSCIPNTDPGTCDDNDCENGVEMWNPNTCQCDPGVPPAEFNITIDDEICNTTNTMYNLVISVSGGVNPYTVTEMNGLTVTNPSGDIFIVEDIVSGAGVTIIVTDDEGCVTTYTSAPYDCNCIVINPPVEVQSISYCEDAPIPSFIANDPGTGFEIRWYDATGAEVGTGLTYTPSAPTAPGIAETYSASIVEIATDCASDLVSVNILQVQLPAAIIFQDSATLDCVQSTYEILTEVTPGTYEWTGPNSEDLGSNQTITVTDLGTYTLTVYEAVLGCASQDSILIIDNQDFPMLVIADPDAIDCDTDMVSLSGAGSQSSATIENYWIGPNGPTDTISYNLDATATQPGVYTLYGYDSDNSCLNDMTVTVSLNNVPPTIDAGELITMDCDMSPINLAGTSNDPQVTYTWSGPNNFTATILDPIVDNPGMYYLTGLDPNNGCTNIDSVLVDVNTNVIAALDLEVGEPECFDEEDGYISIANVDGGTPPYTYSLDGETYFTAAQFFNLGAGGYTVYIQDSDGCQYEEVVNINQPDQILIDLGPDITISLGDSLMVASNTNTSYDSIIWNGSDLIDCDTCPVVELTPQIATELSATIFSGDCQATDEVTIFVDKERLIYFPTSFTPNGDGFNDIFSLYAGTGAERVIELSIFNRWGEIVYTEQNFMPNDQTIGWDGKLNGKYLNPAVFIYMARIEFSDGKTEVFTGDIALMR